MVIKSNSPFAGAEERSALWQALPQILAVCVKNVLLLGYGMTLGFPTILIPSISGNNKDEIFSLGQEGISWIGSINLICVPVGCLLSGLITQPIGRKRAMQYVNVPFLVSWLLLYFSNDLWQVFFALALTGLAGGLMEAPIITYVAEITVPSLRGILASTSSVAVISGILIQFLLGTWLNWRVVAFLSSAVPILSTFLLFLIPESPHWLISKNRLDEAHQSIAWLRGWCSLEEVRPEFEELCKQMGRIPIEQSDEKLTVPTKLTKMETLRLFKKKNFIKPYLLICTIFLVGHFSGTTSLQTYAVQIFGILNTPINKYYVTIFLGVGEVFGSILSVCLVWSVGKRVMNFFSLMGCGLSFLIVATYAYCLDINYIFIEKTAVNMTSPDSNITGNVFHSYQWIPVVFLISAAFFTHCGIRLLPWMLIGEVYPAETRALASGLNGAFSYVFSFTSNKTFLSLIDLMTLPGVFWFNSAVSFMGTAFLYFALPETEGKTLFEITEHYSGNGKLDNKVCRPTSKSKNGLDNKGFSSEEGKTKNDNDIPMQNV